MGRSKRIVDLLLGLWPLYKLGLWMGKQPGLGNILQPAFSTRIHQVTMLPVNEPIAQGEQTVLPYALLLELIERSSACFIMAECMCRRHENCQSHPIDLGCLFLGDGAAHIHPTLGKRCDPDEAKAHIQRGMQAGLYPLIAHTVLDSLTLGIPYKRMLTVCFCCECCCVVQRGLRQGPASLLKVIKPLPGLKMTVDAGCIACGDCLEICPVAAISLNHRGAEISQMCRGCGICLNTCSYQAIHMEIDGKMDLLAAFMDRMQCYADITSQGNRST